MLRYMHVELAKAGQDPDFRYAADLPELKGRDITLPYKSRDAAVLERLEFEDHEIVDPKVYDTPHRPRLHFSPRLGWMNDINGTYWQDGLYHVFYQFNPVTTSRGAGFDMHWGHSVSRDLMNWEEWPVGLFPDAAGQCYSGTTVMQQYAIPVLNEGVRTPVQGNYKATVRNIIFSYESGMRTLNRGNESTVIHPGESLDARFVIDRGLVESFRNGGGAAYAVGSLHTDGGPAFAIEGGAMTGELIVYPMTPARFTKRP